MGDAFDPAEHKAAEVKEELESASEEEKTRIAAAELQRSNPRKTVLEAAGVDPDARMDASGRVLYPWETSPKSED